MQKCREIICKTLFIQKESGIRLQLQTAHFSDKRYWCLWPFPCLLFANTKKIELNSTLESAMALKCMQTNKQTANKKVEYSRIWRSLTAKTDTPRERIEIIWFTHWTHISIAFFFCFIFIQSHSCKQNMSFHMYIIMCAWLTFMHLNNNNKKYKEIYANTQSAIWNNGVSAWCCPPLLLVCSKNGNGFDFLLHLSPVMRIVEMHVCIQNTV